MPPKLQPPKLERVGSSKKRAEPGKNPVEESASVTAEEVHVSKLMEAGQQERLLGEMVQIKNLIAAALLNNLGDWLSAHSSEKQAEYQAVLVQFGKQFLEVFKQLAGDGVTAEKLKAEFYQAFMGVPFPLSKAVLPPVLARQDTGAEAAFGGAPTGAGVLLVRTPSNVKCLQQEADDLVARGDFLGAKARKSLCRTLKEKVPALTQPMHEFLRQYPQIAHFLQANIEMLKPLGVDYKIDVRSRCAASAAVKRRVPSAASSGNSTEPCDDVYDRSTEEELDPEPEPDVGRQSKRSKRAATQHGVSPKKNGLGSAAVLHRPSRQLPAWMLEFSAAKKSR